MWPACAATGLPRCSQTDNEIVVASNDNGRASYQNAGKTRRRGMG
jgi:hypothetical protein